MKAVLALLVAFVMVMGLAVDSASATHDQAPCADVTLVFARGSGQDLSFREVPRFFEKVTDRLDGVAVNAYELGDQEHNGAQYPAVGLSFVNLIESEASWTGFLGGQYRASVAEGVTELTAYMNGRAEECPDEIFTVGGYSQGAQVVGETLPGLSREIRDRIAFVPLFGDPKLYLPEGRGLFPPACRGQEFSPWRRGNVSCFTDNGILEARDPYLPSDLEARTGSWCDRNDHVCNNNLADWAFTAHDYYADDGAEIDEAAQEIAEELVERLPADLAQGIDTSVFVLAAGASGIDVAFLIDTTGSMGGEIAAAKSVADEVGTAIVDLNGRVALTEYRDASDSFVAEVRTPLTTDIGAFRSALGTLVASGGGDTPEALLTALMTTFDTLDWTPGATKAAVVLTDAGYHDPDVANGWTLSDVVARSLEIDPVNVYPVVPSYTQSSYLTLAESTAGQVIVDTGDTAAALTEAFEAVSTRPVVILPFDEFFAAPGDTVEFEVVAYDIDSDIAWYDWDFDADGSIDASTTEPSVSHVYAEPFSGYLEVRAYSADGGVGSAAASIEVSSEGLLGLAPDPPSNVRSELVDSATRTFRVSWDEAGPSSGTDGWAVLDDLAELVARPTVNVTAVLISDVPMSGAEVSVLAFNQYGSSEATTVALAPAAGFATFDDVPQGHVFFDDIEWLARAGITQGCNPPANDMYCPAKPVTRGQMAAFLHRGLAKAIAVGIPAEFTDDDTSIFESDIEWLGSVDITRGCNPPANDRFCPNKAVTRGQMAAFLVRALSLEEAGSIDFVDDDGTTFEVDIEKLAYAGITLGCNPPTNDQFCPSKAVTRAQMAAFLHRALAP